VANKPSNKFIFFVIYYIYRLTIRSAEEISDFIQKFKSEDNSAKIIEFVTNLYSKLTADDVRMSAKLYKTMVSILVSFQRWDMLIDIMKSSDEDMLKAEKRTLQFIKENLIYCLDTKLRGEIRDRVVKLEIY
jgi:hypothetical protein